MRKLLKKLQRWYNEDHLDKDIILTNWQRRIIYDFIIDFIKGVKEYNGR